MPANQRRSRRREKKSRLFPMNDCSLRFELVDPIYSRLANPSEALAILHEVIEAIQAILSDHELV